MDGNDRASRFDPSFDRAEPINLSTNHPLHGALQPVVELLHTPQPHRHLLRRRVALEPVAQLLQMPLGFLQPAVREQKQRAFLVIQLLAKVVQPIDGPAEDVAAFVDGDEAVSGLGDGRTRGAVQPFEQRDQHGWRGRPAAHYDIGGLGRRVGVVVGDEVGDRHVEPRARCR